jgi:hypothetical protein
VLKKPVVPDLPGRSSTIVDALFNNLLEPRITF